MDTLTIRDWVGLLTARQSPCRERVVFAGGFRKRLRITKAHWETHFSGHGGITLRRGKPPEIVRAASGGPILDIPAWAADELGLGRGTHVCITQSDGSFHLKRLEPIERSSEVPGCVVVDELECLGGSGGGLGRGQRGLGVDRECRAGGVAGLAVLDELEVAPETVAGGLALDHLGPSLVGVGLQRAVMSSL